MFDLASGFVWKCLDQKTNWKSFTMRNCLPNGIRNNSNKFAMIYVVFEIFNLEATDREVHFFWWPAVCGQTVARTTGLLFLSQQNHVNPEIHLKKFFPTLPLWAGWSPDERCLNLTQRTKFENCEIVLQNSVFLQENYIWLVYECASLFSKKKLEGAHTE